MASPAVSSPGAVRILFISPSTTVGRPRTRWGELAANSNDVVLKSHLTACKMLAILGGFLLLGGCALFYISRRKNFLIGFFASSAVSFVASTVYGFLSLGEDKKPLLQQREAVKNSIESLPLGKIRQFHPEEVVSTQELNEWAQYFLHTQSFKRFMEIQWSSIFGFKHKPETERLIEQQYLYSVYYPDNPDNLQLYQEVFSSSLLSGTERDKLILLKNAIKKHLSGTPSLFWVTYKEVRDRHAWNETDSNLRSLYGWLFTLFIWKQNIGIVGLKEGYIDELAFFFPGENALIYSYIADREVQLEYAKFVERNGVNTIRYITNYHVFARFVLLADQGLLESRKVFSITFERFGAKIPELEEAIIQQEWINIGNRTYTDIRNRTGIEAIEQISDQKIRDQLKEKFLKLPPAELANREKYKRDIIALGVSARDIQLKLAESWGTMKIKEILVLPQDSQKLILEQTELTQLRVKALEEIKDLSIDEIIRDYRGLIEKGILPSSEYNYTARLNQLEGKQLSSLISDHGDFLFNFKLLEPSDPTVQLLAFSFICENAQVYLSDSTLPSMGMWEMIKKYPLIISERTKQLRNNTNQKRADEHKRHQQESQKLENQLSLAKKNIEDLAKQKKALTETNYRRQNAGFEQAAKELEAKQASQKAIQFELQDLRSRIESAKTTYQENKSRVAEIQQKQEKLRKMTPELLALEKQHKEQLQNIRDGEEKIEKANLNGRLIITVQSEVKDNECQYAKLKKDIEALRIRFDELVVKASKETRAGPQNLVEGSHATDSREKVSVFKPPAGTQVSTEGSEPQIVKEIRELGVDIGAKDQCLTTLKSQIEQKKAAITKTIQEISESNSLNGIKKKKEELAARHRDLTQEKIGLEKDCQDVEFLIKKRDQDRAGKKTLKQALKTKQENLRKIQSDIQELTQKKKSAQDSFDKAQRELDQISMTSVAQEAADKQKCEEKYTQASEDEQQTHAKALEEIQSEAKKSLQSRL